MDKTIKLYESVTSELLNTGKPLLFDKTELLERLNYDHEFVRDIMDDAILEIPKLLNTLQQHSREGVSSSSIHFHAQALYDLAATLHLNGLREIALEVATAAKEDCIQSAQDLLIHVRCQTIKAMDALNC